MFRIPLVIMLAFFSAAALADAQAGKKKAQLCLICHKPGFAAATLPTLEGQQAEYLRNQIVAFKENRRSSPIMQTNVKALSDEDIRDIVDYFSSSPPANVTFGLDATQVAAGKDAAESRGCARCHLPDYSGNGEIPRLAGMDPAYTATQIEAFVRGERAHPEIGKQSGISSADTAALAQYFAQVD